MSDLADMQQRVLAFSDERDWAQFHSPRNLAMALSVEASELVELYLWCKDEGPQPMVDSRTPDVELEVADIMICLLNFCGRTGIDLKAAVDKKLAIAAEKYPAELVRGKALKYDEY